MGTLKEVGSQFRELIKDYIRGDILLAIGIIRAFFWKRIKKKAIIFFGHCAARYNNDVTIYYALASEDETYNTEILHRMKEGLSSKKKIILKKIDPISNSDEADKHANNISHGIVIYGRIGNILNKNGEGQCESKIYMITKLMNQHKLEYTENILHINDSFPYIENFASNTIALVSQLIGIALLSLGDIKEGLDLLKRHCKNRELLQRLYLFSWNYIYNKYPMDSKLQELLDLSAALIALNPNDLTGLVSAAYCSYKLGEKSAAIKYTDKISLLSVYGAKLHAELNRAFFCLLDKDYKGAWQHYKIVKSFKNMDINIGEVLGFLEKENRTKNDFNFMFASGFLSYYFGDKTLATEDLKAFLSKYKEELSCAEFEKKAHKLIN